MILVFYRAAFVARFDSPAAALDGKPRAFRAR